MKNALTIWEMGSARVSRAAFGVSPNASLPLSAACVLDRGGGDVASYGHLSLVAGYGRDALLRVRLKTQICPTGKLTVTAQLAQDSNQFQTVSGQKISVFICAHLWPKVPGGECRLLKPFEAFYNLLKGKIKESFFRCTNHLTELTQSAESSLGSVHFVHSVKNRLPFPLCFAGLYQPM